jgi:hypothetical protein
MEKPKKEILGTEDLGAKAESSPHLAEALKAEEDTLGLEAEEMPGWKKKALMVLLGITVLASGMAGTTKEAKAQGFHFGQMAAQSMQQGLNMSINDLFQTGQERRQIERDMINRQLNRADQAYQQELNARNQMRQLSIDQVRQEIRQIDNRINTYEQVKTEAIRKLGTPGADTATIRHQIAICEGEIGKLKRDKAAYLQAATGISPAPSSQMSPTPGYAPSPSPPEGQWRPAPSQTPAPSPQMRPRSGRTPPPPGYSDEKPLPPLPDL